MVLTGNVYERLEIKLRNGSTELDHSEREKLEDLLIDTLTHQITHITDEQLMEWANEVGVI